MCSAATSKEKVGRRGQARHVSPGESKWSRRELSEDSEVYFRPSQVPGYLRLLLQYGRELREHLVAFLPGPDRDPQRAFAAILCPSEPDDDLVRFGHVRIDFFRLDVVRLAVRSADLGEDKVGVVGAEDPDDPVDSGQLVEEVRPVVEEGLDVGPEEGEARGGEGAESERGGRRRDVVRRFDVVQDLDDLGRRDGDTETVSDDTVAIESVARARRAHLSEL